MIHAIKGPAANTFAEHMKMFCGHVAWRGYGMPETDFRALQSRHDDCKRCLASLAKRDREFQRKARRFYRGARGAAIHRSQAAFESGQGRPWDAARAIAREEGRAL